jgi:predicted SprT family Zn-dependent metalloprotease
MEDSNNIIPKTFDLFGEKYRVSHLKEIDKGKSFGHAIYTENRIKLAKTVGKKKIQQDQIESTYCHELTHIILDALGHTELSGNEEFVDSFGKALHQILKSSKYE